MDENTRLSILKAILQSALSNLTVDRATRIATGLTLLENNRDVTYKGADGKPIGFRTNDGLIDGLIQQAGNRGIPAHLTHEWTEGKRDALNSRVGAFKNFRKDESGNLVGDYHAMPGVEGDKMLWLAENDPENAALSLVFDYNKIPAGEITYAYPLSFDSADFVAKGAACARLSELQTDTDMTEDQVKAIVAEAVKAELSTFKPAGYITPEEADTKVKAALAAYVPVISDAKIEEIAIAAEAKAVAKLGAGPLLQSLTKSNDEVSKYKAELAKYIAVAPNRPTAVARFLKDNPDMAGIHAEETRIACARLTGQLAAA